MSTRKRSRQSLVDAQEEEDELSPTKGTLKEKPVLGSLKRRKLNYHTSSPTPKFITPKGAGIIGSLKGIFGYGSDKGKENTQSEEIDELSGDLDMAKDPDDIWDVPEENDQSSSRRKSTRGRTSTRKAEDATMKDVWDVNVSESLGGGNTPTPRRSAGRPRKGVDTAPNSTQKRTPATPATPAKKGVDEDPPSLQRMSARPRKSDILKKAKAMSREDIRNRLSQPEEQGEEAQSGSSKPSRKRSRNSMRTTDIVEAGTDDIDAISVPRKRGRPKALDRDAEAVAASPRGILTPSKNRGVRVQKSVVFETAEVDLGFKDIPTSSTKHPFKPMGDITTDVSLSNDKDAPLEQGEGSIPEEEIDLDVGDDVACIICGGLDSDEPNEIVLCDNCDRAFHQLCYDVPVIPEDEWLCKDCRPDLGDLVPLGSGRAIGDLGIPGDTPDIDGFAEHLKNIQRLVLDKLTGQRRVKLIGHSEEMQKVTQVVEQTILAGEGNSMLVIGARGCGKTNVGHPLAYYEFG